MARKLLEPCVDKDLIKYPLYRNGYTWSFLFLNEIFSYYILVTYLSSSNKKSSNFNLKYLSGNTLVNSNNVAQITIIKNTCH